MNALGWLQIALYLGVLAVLAKPLGLYLVRVYEGRPFLLDRVLGPLERLTFRLSGVRPSAEMTWRGYAGALLAFNLLGDWLRDTLDPKLRQL